MKTLTVNRIDLKTLNKLQDLGYTVVLTNKGATNETLNSTNNSSANYSALIKHRDCIRDFAADQNTSLFNLKPLIKRKA